MDSLSLIPAVHAAFQAFKTDTSYLALPLVLANSQIESLPLIRPKSPVSSFQNSLNELDAVLNSRTPLYVILRRNQSLFAITYVPYLAEETQRTSYLNYRSRLIRQLGEEQFSLSLICKEIGEITDARSWEERDNHIHPGSAHSDCHDDCGLCADISSKPPGVKDLGYKKNKCRLCDRRMKNKISPEALDALKKLDNLGALIQISVNILTEILELEFVKEIIAPEDVATYLPTNKPTFTFFRHPTTRILYFIFHSPDSASVQERMKHTMAIPGLINVHAEDQGVHVDEKIEIHDPNDLDFPLKDERVGKFRSVYLRNKFQGTESAYESLEADKTFYDNVK
ncbi:hypothetical protein BKA66DRAFT_226985 [Pyrenochaeta sp. MPI-SDFR-AT-0127]|nr:hypothetical protein BKA66DRAFT_226985 [Pyrenochaeta sp. MPI-SDFR-AT-0127]